MQRSSRLRAVQDRRELRRHLRSLLRHHSEVQIDEHHVRVRGLSFERRLQRRHARLQYVDERLPGAPLV